MRTPQSGVCPVRSVARVGGLLLYTDIEVCKPKEQMLWTSFVERVTSLFMYRIEGHA